MTSALASVAVTTATILAVTAVSMIPTSHPAQPDWQAAEDTLLASQLAAAIGTDECIDPAAADRIPRWVVVSWLTDGIYVSNDAQRLPLAEAWKLAEEGEAYVRCVIV